MLSMVVLSCTLIMLVPFEPGSNAAEVHVVNPRCEYLTDPLGIDTPRPRLSWVVETQEYGWKQSAYQIKAASDAGKLARGEADLWDSGKVAGEDSTAVVYGGRPLRVHESCYWMVRVFDALGNASGWSVPGRWSLGPRRAGEWAGAQWIGLDSARQVSNPVADLAGAKWIWHAADKGPNKPKCHRLFVASFTPPGDSKIDKAELVIAADDFFRCTINGILVASGQPGGGGWEQAVLAPVTVQVIPGVANNVRVEVENASESPAGLIARLRVVSDDGRETILVTDGSWKSVNEPGRNWHNRPLNTTQWPNVSVVGEYGVAPWGRLRLASLKLPPPVQLRTLFRLDKPVKRGILYSTALGVHDVYINGRRVHNDYFNPGWTDYTKRVYYRAYDVAPLLRQGDNALGAILADGWYSGYVGFGKRRDHYGKKPRVRMLLHVEYTDGSAADIVSGPDWKGARGGTLEADFLMGEKYDARIASGHAMSRWAEPDYGDAAWSRVDTGAELNPQVEHSPAPAVCVIDKVKPRSVKSPKPGVYVFDMGRNFAGVVELRVRAEKGQVITLRYAERLNPDGTIYTANLRDARATDVYIASGEGEESWSPRFTYHGFQYVEVTGLKQQSGLDVVTGLVLSSDTPRVGSFACSDLMLNQLVQNIYTTQRSNFIDIPTDCPQRDERLGWTGDAQVYIASAALNCDVQAFFTKWLRDLADGQRADGQFPMVAPVKVAGDDGGPAWADAGVICPWTIYQFYGDHELLERQYPSMVKFIEFCLKRSTAGLAPPAQFHCFGDWLSINADTPKEILYSAYFAYSTHLTAEAAKVLGKTEDAARFDALFQRIKAAFLRDYVAPDGRIKGDTQTSYVLPLAFDLLDGKLREMAARRLVENIEARGHLSTGFIGTKSLMQALSKIGRDDVALKLLHTDTFPSWGFSIKQGATSIWERWDGWTPEKGFQDPGMNSFAHYSFGAVYQWMVEHLGGIRLAEPGYKRVVIEPVFDPTLTWVEASYASLRGRIRTRWERSGGGLSLAVTIPANTTARIVIPASESRRVLRDGQPLRPGRGVASLELANDRLAIEVGSGEYALSFPQLGL